MKPILVLLGVGIVSGGLYFFVTYGSTTEAENPTVEEVQEEVIVVEEVDVLDEAQEALDKANLLLDEEETRLLEERAVIDQRLEQIIEKRTSF